jgi:hypothetical protein
MRATIGVFTGADDPSDEDELALWKSLRSAQKKLEKSKDYEKILSDPNEQLGFLQQLGFLLDLDGNVTYRTLQFKVAPSTSHVPTTTSRR